MSDPHDGIISSAYMKGVSDGLAEGIDERHKLNSEISRLAKGHTALVNMTMDIRRLCDDVVRLYSLIPGLEHRGAETVALGVLEILNREDTAK